MGSLLFPGIFLALWAFWLGRQPGVPRWMRYAPIPLLIVGIGGPLLTARALNDSFRDVQNVDPSAKATRLAEGISAAMNWTAGAIGLLLVSAVVLGVVQVRRRKGDDASD